MGTPRECKDDIEEWKREIKDAFDSSNYDNLSTLLNGVSRPAHFVEAALREEPWIFISLCHLGIAKIIERFLTMFSVDVNRTHNGMTGLQSACQAGHSYVAEILLSSGAQLRSNIWEENSEFYLATLNGYEEVVKVLLKTKPELICDMESIYCLFLCACKGGHLKMVHKWLTPEVDVNREVSYVSSLNDCENQYPLFAACKGDHYDVAEFLITDLSARITKDICCSFPDIACRLVRNIFMTMNNAKEPDFQLQELELDFVDPKWFEDSDGNESSSRDSDFEMFGTKINLSKNRLSSLPATVLWQLPSLSILNVSQNPLKAIPNPSEETRLDLSSITSLLLSHCQLKTLNIHIFQLPNLEELNVSHNQIDILYGEIDAKQPWKCLQLKNLDLSHNCLSTVPSDIKGCTSLELLCLSNNALTSLCSPWPCPLKTLDISHNKLSFFPPSCDQFWTETLQVLKVSHNHLDRLPESIVRMNVLTNLDLSFNEIRSMPEPSIWSCPLFHLNLSHNKLGREHSQGSKASFLISLRKNHNTLIMFPHSNLAASLNELFLDNNSLHALPDGVCHLRTLTILDISHNQHLKSLPLEIGMLWNLLVLRMEGIKVEDKETQSRIDALIDPKAKFGKTYDFVMYMEQRRRNCMHHDHIKMVVFGCKNSGSQCVVQRLINHGKSAGKYLYENEHKSLCVTKWTLPYSKKFQTQFKRDLTFRVWEFPHCKRMVVTHPCFLTQNSLYLIVHDAFYDEDDLAKVTNQVAAIQASVLQPCIIVVCIFQSLRNQFLDELHEKLNHKIKNDLKCHYVPVNLDDRSSMDSLYETIYTRATQMQDVTYGKSCLLVNRKVPKLFIDIVNRMNTFDKMFCSQDELLTSLDLEVKDLQDTVDRRLKLQEYLLQVGAMLHYNVQIGYLWNLVILDPVWLYDLLTSFMQLLSSKRPKIGIEMVKNFAAEKIALDLFPAFISLLELFNIGVQLEDINGKKSLLIPSLLSKQPPAFQSDDMFEGLSASRLYTLPAIPRAMWSHIMSQLIPAFNRISDPSSTLPDSLTQTDDTKKSFKRGTRKSHILKNLCVKNKGIQFWRSGIMVWHDQGLIMVEEAIYQPDGHPPNPAILVTVKSRTGVSKPENTKTPYKDLAIIGVITDELEEILDLFNPKLMEFMHDCHPIALCPHCHKGIKPGQGIIKQEINHFHVRICAQRLIWEDYVFCGKNAVYLNHLMPEFMFLELPEKFCIKYEDIEFTNKKLGQGNAGTVSKGRFREMDVAVKSFYTPAERPVFDREEDPMYPNIGMSDMPSLSMTQKDNFDTENQRVMNAFLELRREVSILSKLKHRCIIAFLGVCVKQQLLLVLELAPFGSFRSVLNEAREKSSVAFYRPNASEPAVVTKSIFGKDLTYKILLQVASGLSYLHNNSIIFRDLKPDNILVLSMDLHANVNVKVSDYGISRFSTYKGVSGIAGTVCYMAPEVLAKQTYTNKVDVYSLGIVMFETVTGVAPAELYGSNQRPMVSEIAKSLVEPLHVKLYKVNCNFPYMENLMKECWAFRMDTRPSVREVLREMSSAQCLLLHDALWTDQHPLSLRITCIYACQSGGRMCLWISESPQEGCSRFLSVYDIASSTFTVHRKEVPGFDVIAMAKVKNKIWLISKNCYRVDELVRSKQNKFEVNPGKALEEEASCLTCHKGNVSENCHPFVLVGHTNGSITAFYTHMSQNRTVSTTTHLDLGTSSPVSNIVTVKDDSLIAASGHTVFSLTIEKQMNQYGLLHLSITVAWSFSFHKTLKIMDHLNLLVADGNSIWCSFRGKNRIIKLDLEKKCVEENLMLCFDYEKKQVNVTGFTSNEHEEMSDLDESTISKSVKDEVDCNSSQTSFSCQSFGNEQQIDDGLIYCNFPCGSSQNAISRDPHLASLEETLPDLAPPVPMRIKTPNFANDNGNDFSFTPKQMESEPVTSQHPSSAGRSFTHGSNHRPRLPVRRSTVSKDIKVTSLHLVSDLMAVGTDCNGLFLLPVSGNVLEDCPLHLPLLQHPKKLNDGEMNIDSSWNSSCGRFKVESNLFAVSEIIQAGNKLVSLIKDHGGSSIISRIEKAAKPTPQVMNAEIAIWDEMSDERLSVIKSYTESFV